MGIDFLCSLFDLGIGGIGLFVCDGIVDCFGEDVLFLCYDVELVVIVVDIEFL